MCLIKICQCGCNTQTREILDTLITVNGTPMWLKQIKHTCDNCGRSFLNAMEKRWNMNQIEEVKHSE